MSGQDITFEVNGKPVNGYLALPAVSNAPGVIVLHAWWGLNRTFKNLCDRLAAEGFVAFAPDLNEGRIATTIDEAKEIMSELDSEQKYAVTNAAVDFLHDRPEVQNGPFALVTSQVEQAEAELDAFLASIPAPTLQGTVRLGSPAHVILGVAREWDADLVVLGTHARRGMPRFFLGSVAETVLRKAPCSALVIPPAAVLSAGAEQEAGTAGPVAEREPTAEAR